MSRLRRATRGIRHRVGLVSSLKGGAGRLAGHRDVSGNSPAYDVALTGKLPGAGWYMLEFSLQQQAKVLELQLVVDYPERGSDSERFFVRANRGRLNKRLVYFAQRPTALSLSLPDEQVPFSILAFHAARLTRRFAHNRLARRLANHHTAWQGRKEQEVLALLRVQAEKSGLALCELAIATYNETFLPTLPAINYSDWLARQPKPFPATFSQRNEAVHLSLATVFPSRTGDSSSPLISVIVTLRECAPLRLVQCLESVQAQHFSSWQLCLCVPEGIDEKLKEIAQGYASSDSRVQVIFTHARGNREQADVLALADGEYVAWLDPADRLADDALLCVAERIAQAPACELLYSDEDGIDEYGMRRDPCFKPDWNPDLLLSHDYIGALAVIRTRRLRDLYDNNDGAHGYSSYEILLRCGYALPAEQIAHIPQVLYHRFVGDGASRGEAEGTQGIADFLHKVEPRAQILPGAQPGINRIVWPLPEPRPLVSLIIPTRDGVDILRPCVDAILALTDYPAFELLIIDNESECPETLSYLASLRQDRRVRVLEWHAPFNYSAINNYAVEHAKGDIIALVNNDIEPISTGWLDEMVRHACRKEIGCVGAKLYYPDDTIQHAGVIVGLWNGAGHSHKYFRRDEPGYCNRLLTTQNLSAVTAACLVMRREVFHEVGGFDAEHLAVAFNDVDLCLKVQQAGYRNLWTPYAELYHHESASRGHDDSPEKVERAKREIAFIRQRWPEVLAHDPAYNPNLTRAHEDFSLR